MTPDYDDEEAEEFFANVRALLMTTPLVGNLVPGLSERKFFLRWVCPSCNHLHTVRGKLSDIQGAATYFMLMGHPLIEISDAAFQEVASMEGLDLDVPVNIPKVAEHFREFTKSTRG